MKCTGEEDTGCQREENNGLLWPVTFKKPTCYLVVCPNCEAQIDLMDAAFEAVEISLEIASRFAANDPLHQLPDADD